MGRELHQLRYREEISIMIKLHLFDIEGTTTDINFVHQVLFPYSEKYLESFILHHQTNASVASALEATRKTVWDEEKKQLGLYEVIAKLKHWIKTDRKHGALKEIQGLIWDVGYRLKDFQGHVYPEVRSYFEAIKEKNFQIGIYSSGSVHAQKLIFEYSNAGDLTPFISYYFDTKVGGKREANSYLEISKQVNLKPEEILFYSDIPEELTAAKLAGLQVVHVKRPGTATSSFKTIVSFQPSDL